MTVISRKPRRTPCRPRPSTASRSATTRFIQVTAASGYRVLGRPNHTGLVHARAILKKVPGISVVELTNADIVRHKLVWRILEAYEGSPRREKKKRTKTSLSLACLVCRGL